MDNQRVLIWALFLLMAWMTWQAWQRDYGVQAPPAAPADTQQAVNAPDMPAVEEDDLPAISAGDDTARFRLKQTEASAGRDPGTTPFRLDGAEGGPEPPEGFRLLENDLVERSEGLPLLATELLDELED